MDSGFLLALVDQAQNAASGVSGGLTFNVSIGDILQIVTTLGVVTSARTKVLTKMAELDTKVEALWGEYERRRHVR